MRTLLERCYALLLSLWLGAQVVVGAIVAPALFASLPDRSMAGTVAGEIFARLGVAGVIGLALLLALRAGLDASAQSSLSGRAVRAPRWVHYLLLLALVLTGFSHFWVRTNIASVRQQVQLAGGFASADPALVRHFGALHGLSSGLFLITALIALALVLRLRDSAVAD